MKICMIEEVVLTNSNIPENYGIDGTIYPFVLTDGYAEGIQRYYNNRLWTTLALINPLANYEFFDIDPLRAYLMNLHTQMAASPMIVTLALDEIIYFHSTKKYYKSLVAESMTFSVGMTIDPLKLEDLGTNAEYRYTYDIPVTGSTKWKDKGSTNRNRCVDKAFNKKSIYPNEINVTFVTKNIDVVTLFNVDANTAQIIVTNKNSTVILNNTLDLLDTSSIINWRTRSRYVRITKKTVQWNIPFAVGEVTIQIILKTPSADVELGEILPGSIINLATTLTKVPSRIKSKGKIVEQPNGDVILLDEGDPTKVYKTFSFNLLFPVKSYDTFMRHLGFIINRRVVVFGENIDEPQYQTLIIYALAREATPDFDEKEDQNLASIEFETFT